MGADIVIDVLRRGHYPKGGGIARVKIAPVYKLRPITLVDQGKILEIRGLSHCVRLPKHVAERQAKAARGFFEALGYRTNIALEFYGEDDKHLGPGSGIVLWAETTSEALLEGDALGARGKPAEKVGREAAEELYRQIKLGGAVDVHHTDQLVIFMALADGVSRIRSSQLSMHTITAIHLARLVVKAKVDFDGRLNEPGLLSVVGIGFSRQ